MAAKPNRLIKEKSPYLLQHAFNPVDWMAWGDEPFVRAAAEDKPIFLSIGYSTCHWCHVMAHESFADPKIAELLNKGFISIKVDREDRPDIDQMYMAATQTLRGSGGWPMSVFLMPDGSPFYAGTYFSPVSSQHRPGFADVLGGILEAWRNNRSEIEQAAEKLVSSLHDQNKNEEAILPDTIAKRCLWMLAQENDPTHGGFGHAPKFPRPALFYFLFNYFAVTGENKAKDMSMHTLEKMAAGGIHDHLGGGFHRYSVDDTWFVPHFEKMLYDQSQLAMAYLEAFRLSGDDSYALVARQLFAYLLRDMRDPGGGFYSAEDADSENPYSPGGHGEGAYYLWTEAEIREILHKDDVELFIYSYGVHADGNVEHDRLQEFTGRNILFRARSADEAGTHFGMGTDHIEQRLAVSRAILFARRSERKRPHLDDKIITSWNGLLIGALARGSIVLKDPVLLEYGIQAATFIRKHLYNEQSETLMRRYREGEAGLAGQLADYAALTAGLIELYQAAQNPVWLQWAVALTTRQIELFWNEDGNFFYDSVADTRIAVRMKSSYDGAEPAANSLAVANLIQLGRLRSMSSWLDMATQLIQSFGTAINRYPPALPLMLSAWQRLNARPVQVVIAGDQDSTAMATMRQTAEQCLPPGSLLLLADGGKNQQFLAEQLPYIKTLSPLNGKPTAYVCIDFACSLPMTSPAKLQQTLEEIRPSA